MTSLLINIKELLQIRDKYTAVIIGEDMKILPSIENAYLKVENGIIADFGPMSSLKNFDVDTVIDAEGKTVLPTWCDSHTHIVFSGNREQEFVDRINGLTYEDMAARGGGILNSAKKLRQIDEEELFQQSMGRVMNVIKMGTGALEIKSGYGLSTDSEIKMLKVINRIKAAIDIPIKSTFLGAHAIPNDFRENRQGYIDLLITDMIPKIADSKLAEYIDVFCEKNYFNLDDTYRILKSGNEHGLIPKIHVNQFNAFGGVALAVKQKALSVDHLEELRDEDIEALKGSNTIAVALPACSFFINIPYTPARRIIDSRLPLALATDYNPGSSPSGNMNLVVSLACIKMNMTPEEAINAATLNGAYAMGCSKDIGSITIGKKANLIITKKIPSYHFLPYSFGDNLIEKVVINGKLID